MYVCIQGCTHGQFSEIYEDLERYQLERGIKFDLLLCCGDIEAVRNEDDMNCISSPPKYRFMKSFHKYYSGEKTAPILTICIGGNHEASNHLQELPFGGWLCPNIYFLGNWLVSFKIYPHS